MPRRPKGTGSIRLRGRIWWITFYVFGLPVAESSESEDRNVAVNLLQRRIGEAAAGRDVTPEKATIADLCALVLADYRFRKLRDAAMVQWRYEAHLRGSIGSLPAARFGARQVREYVEARRAAGASDATINRELAIVRRGFTLGHREDPPLVRRVPHIAKLEEDNARQGFIEDVQYRLLSAAMPDHLKTLFVVGYHAGARLGELRKLRWNQVDMGAMEIRVERGQAKAKRARTIPIYGDMVEWLEWQRKRVTGERVFCWRQPAAIRVAPKEKPLGSHLKGWDTACESAGLPGLHFHDLRRSAVRAMERAGIPRNVAMQISGHRTESVYRRYDIVAATDLQSAAAKLAEYHRKQTPKLKRVK